MSMYTHWGNCITHSKDKTDHFIRNYFSDDQRKCLLLAGAGFDPRSCVVPLKLAHVLSTQLQAIFVREERPKADALLVDAANTNEKLLRDMIPNCDVETVDIIAEDGAAVGGTNIRSTLMKYYKQPGWLEGVTDVVLDMSALSIGIAYPMAKFLLQVLEKLPGTSFHIMATSNPILDGNIRSEPHDSVKNVPGFNRVNNRAKTNGNSLEPKDAKIWLPHLASNKLEILNSVQSSIADLYRTCPIVPFPAQNPREADDLIGAYAQALYDSWNVDARDIMYVSEWNPLDSYRRISELKHRYDLATDGIYRSEIIISPVGSKIMSIGALMAAIQHNLTVLYVETMRYEVLEPLKPFSETDITNSNIFHVWLHGPIYEGFGKSIN